MMRIAIYSVYYGNREPFNPSCMSIAKGFDRFVITDRSELQTDAKVITEPLFGLDPKRACSRAKLRPHQYFNDYDWTIYLDNKANLLRNPIEIVEELRCLTDAPFCVFAHGRNCIYEEAKVCIRRGLDHPRIIRQQMKAYSQDGFPTNDGLIQSTLMVRRMGEPVWEKAGDHWFEQVLRYSRRDQLSFNYVIWKLGIKAYYMKGDINQNCYVKWPVKFQDDEFAKHYELIPENVRKPLKKALGKLGILGWIRGKSHKQH